jgi:hypothetical protein
MRAWYCGSGGFHMTEKVTEVGRDSAAELLETLHVK